MLFTELSFDERLQRALATSGFVTPTPIQAEALPVALDGQDLVGTAQTGTGKTAAFVLPILQKLITNPLEIRRTRAVILAPTRELVEQILAVVRELGVHTNIRAVAVYGGIAMQPQTRALRNGVELVVACPGRLLDHMKRRNTDFSQLDCLVLDEADRMLDMGFMPAIQEIIEHLPTTRQTMLFSATFASSLNAFVKETLREPVRIEVDTAVAAQTVHHTLYQLKASMKYDVLTALLRKLAPESDSVLIFTRTRVTANQVADHLRSANMRAGVLHAEKSQRERQDTLEHFRSGMYPYLVATDIAARGIDVTSITHVINFDLPAKTDDYLHRIGRTGRMERTGHAISFMTRADIRTLRIIEKMLGKRIDVAPLEELNIQHTSTPKPATRESAPQPPRPPKQHEAPRALDHPAHPKLQSAKARSYSAPRGGKPLEKRVDRPQRGADAPRSAETPQAAVAPRAPRAPRGERPRRLLFQPGEPQYSEPMERMERRPERPERTERRPERPERVERPGRAERRPERTERPGMRRNEPVSTRAARSQRHGDAPVSLTSREERRRKQFGAPTGHPQRPERAERRRFEGDATAAPKRRGRAADNRYAETATPRTSRQERPSGKPFTGTASTGNYHRKHTAGKRLPGSVPSGPRPSGKYGPQQSTETSQPARTKQRTSRGR